MTVRAGWRPISTEEEAVIRTILCRAKIRGTRVLLDQLERAMVSHSTEWVLNVAAAGGSSELPSGPFPARTLIKSSAGYHGEIIVWIADGLVSGLEYAWIGDKPPMRWPRPEEIDVVSEAGGIGT